MPTWKEMADNRVTNDIGYFTPEFLTKLRGKNCPSSWEERYRKYPYEIPNKIPEELFLL